MNLPRTYRDLLKIKNPVFIEVYDEHELGLGRILFPTGECISRFADFNETTWFISCFSNFRKCHPLLKDLVNFGEIEPNDLKTTVGKMFEHDKQEKLKIKVYKL